MAALGDSYTRLVARLKIILPLAALGILSTLFLMSRSIDPTRSIAFSDPEIRELANRPRIGNPTFAGVTDDGSVINLAADVARPLADNPNTILVEGISAIFESPGGQLVSILAETGTLNTVKQMANLSGGVELATSLGYTIMTDSIFANFATSVIKTTGPIDASGPLGTIHAGLMILQLENGANSDRFELVFRERVIMVYDPKKNRK